jgi:drug/metabolite transporter (DMT)-like permease
VAVPLYLLSWALFDGHLPEALPQRNLAAILYLAIVGSVVGFILYFYVLKRVNATAVGLITLITPVLALWLGKAFNAETIAPSAWAGTGAILLGLLSFQWGGWLLSRFRAPVR